MILADVMKRWQQLKGNQAFLCTGTDEHGMKIQQAAVKEGISPQELCDTNSGKFRELAAAGNISQDVFIRTTEDKHCQAVDRFWTQMKHSLPKQLGLYQGSHEGWYSVSDECFYPNDMVEASITPQTGKKIMVCTETGSAVEWIKEDTWFFPLTKYKDALLKFYDENPNWIQPLHRMNEVRDWVENHLEDLSVTRPAQRLQWGIQDPEDPSQTIYVWVDALINYLTVTGYGDKWHLPSQDMGMWPADMHVVGKDIIRFHAIYWPAMLIALDLPLPKKILCHNHWTMSHRKMSKSVGNVVNPFFAIQRWGVDALRYFLMRNGSLLRDTDYSNDVFHAIYVKELQANLGNLYYRACRPRTQGKWSPREALESYLCGDFEVHQMINNEFDPGFNFSILEPTLDSVSTKFQQNMDTDNVSGALGEIYHLLGNVSYHLT